MSLVSFFVKGEITCQSLAHRECAITQTKIFSANQAPGGLANHGGRQERVAGCTTSLNSASLPQPDIVPYDESAPVKLESITRETAGYKRVLNDLKKIHPGPLIVHTRL